MVLTTAQLEDILAGLKSDKPEPMSERRRQPRVEVRGKIRIIPNGKATGTGDKSAEPVEAWVRDLSRGGIGLLAAAAMVPGDRFTARFSGASGDVMAMEYVVRRCGKAASGWFSIGAHLVVASRPPFATEPIKRRQRSGGSGSGSLPSLS